MNSHRSHQRPIVVEPLPGEVPASLRKLDALLNADVQRLNVPSGMAGRIFQASAPMLPGLPGQPIPFTKPTQPMRVALHQTVWARLALAASVAVACCVAAWILHRPARIVSVAVVNDGNGTALASAFEAEHHASAKYEATLTYLFDTQDVTPEELKGELAMLVSRF